MVAFSKFPTGVLVNINKVSYFDIQLISDGTYIIEANFDEANSVNIYEGTEEESEKYMTKLANGDFPVTQINHFRRIQNLVVNMEKVLYISVDQIYSYKSDSDYELGINMEDNETFTPFIGTESHMLEILHKIYLGWNILQ